MAELIVGHKSDAGKKKKEKVTAEPGSDGCCMIQ